MKKLLFFVGVLACISSYSQITYHAFEDWSTIKGTQNFFHKNVTKLDPITGKVYVAGATMNSSGNYDILVSKFDKLNGAILWTRQINGDANFADFATALYITDSSDVIVTGVITNDSVTFLSDMFTMKLSGIDGSTTWMQTFDAGGNGYDGGTALTVGDSGYVYVAGSGMNTSYNMDMVALKYSSTGILKWSSLYDHNVGNDGGVNIFFNKGVTVTGAGETYTGTGTYDAIAVAFDINDGSLATFSSSGGIPIAANMIYDGAKDIDGNIYIVGGATTISNGYDTYLIKLDSNLAFQWDVTYNGASNLDDVATGVKVDTSGNVYICGYSTISGEGKNFIVIAYDNTGSQTYFANYNDSLNGDDEATSIELTKDYYVVVTGYDSTAFDHKDYFTIKYDQTLTEIWSVRSDGYDHLDDRATNIAIDTLGNVIVTGESQRADGSLEYKTVRYSEKKVIVPTDFGGENRKSNFLYYENKGQIIKTDSTFIPIKSFYTNNTSPLYYFVGDTLSMVFMSADSIGIDTVHRIAVSFTNSNTNKKIYPLKQRPEILNYYLGFCPQGITHIYGNEQLVVPDLYPQIDLIYSSNQNGFKFYFIVKPGGSASAIKMQYTGATSTSLNTGTQNLTINSIVGGITFDQPLFYQINGSNAIVTSSDGYADWHNYTGNSYGFDYVTVLDPTKPLIIEVDQGNGAVASTSAIANLDWSTYVGGNVEDGSADITTDANGDPYITGSTWGNVNFPVSTTFQVYASAYPSLLGSQDMYTMKFDKATRRIMWATYLGGSGVGTSSGTTPALDRANDIKAYKGTNPAKNYVYITGTTWSSDFPVLRSGIFSSAHSFNNSAGKIRCVIAAFTELDGKIHWSTCHGGTSTYISEEGTSLDIDKDGTLIVGGAMTGITGAETSPNIPLVTPSGAYTKNNASGFFILFDNNYAVKWFTLFGSIGGYVNDVHIQIERNGIAGHAKKAYITGKCGVSTIHQLDVVPNPGNEYYQSTCGGGFDAYIARLNIESSYALEYSTYWGGNDDDAGVSIAGNDTLSSLYFAGYTKSTNLNTTKLPNPGGVAYHDSTLSGPSDGFILGFNTFNQNSLDWGTLYGGNQEDAILDMCLDIDQNLYLTGETRSTTGFLQASLGTFYSQSVMGNDVSSTKTEAFILAFNPLHNDVHTTYFGGLQPDGGAGIATDGVDNLFLTGTAISTEGTFPLVEFSTSSPLDWWDGSITNNVSGTMGMPQTYAHAASFTYDGGTYETGGVQASDGFIAGFGIKTAMSIGINEVKPNTPEVGLYPNPVSGSLTLVTNNDQLDGSDVEVINILGQMVKNNIKFNNRSITIDVSELNSGLYFVAIKNKKSYIRIKFIKQ